MSRLSRRTFLKGTAAAVGAVGLAGCVNVDVNVSKKKEIIMPKGGKRVVVLGAGWGGTTAAKYCKLTDPSIEVILIEKLDKFVSCPASNWVIGGFKALSDITFSYNDLASNNGIKLLKTEALGLEPANKIIVTDAGKVEYDKLIVSPGVSFMYDQIEGWKDSAMDDFPHAYKAGPQTQLLRDKLVAMKNGENVVLTVPPKPYRCPPGPYERISLIANYLKNHKTGSKIIVLDPNDGIVSKGKLFMDGWNAYYSDVIEYITLAPLKGIDRKNKVLQTEKGEFKAGVANIIPAMKAGDFAYKAGLVPEGERWAKVNAYNFESEVYKDVHVIGDSTHAGSVGPVPKSGFVANSMGKACALAVVYALNGQEQLPPSLANTCYSLINEEEAIFVSAVYDYDPSVKRIMKTGGGLSPDRREIFGKHARDWTLSIWSDMLT
ncbi:NAD(P)/FAD-dependent oxidoreductase [Limisalsivibrio acetivorans]|uniref:NAD(P)/FAD-dependent oxidoreductase n=1 Tax=Limisalsivibrio acetivorans TaxID=1304888 RepID=UPI0003B4A7BB|nr:NAD(P)/FAD-dependent oxidoreductase [Limisalsivibrio acetivorans]